jgi:excisionase family DNA binding protein
VSSSDARPRPSRTAQANLADALLAALDDEALERLADRLTPFVRDRLAMTDRGGAEAGWMDSARAAEYLGITKNSIHKLTAARAIPFEQDGPGCRCWFKRSELDSWRRRSIGDGRQS